MSFWTTIIQDIEALLAKVKAELGTALSLFIAFIKEAVTEEEAALWPQFQALAIQIFGDETKMAGLNLDARVAVVVADFMAQLPADVALAKKALINSWAWAVAHQQGIVDGNQGNVNG
jgi:hypothetical protein